MSRRDTGPVNQAVIVALAEAFRKTRPTANGRALAQWRRDVAIVAGVLKSFNASLDRERFFREAGEDEKP